MTTLKKINESKYIFFLVLAAIFLIILYCNVLTPLKGDDFCYLYSYKDGSRIESVSDIFVSMYYHRFTTNGRVIPHFFTQLFLLLPLPIFKVINAGIFSIYIYLFHRFAICFSPNKSDRHNVLLLCVIMGAVWVLSPDFGSVYLWLDGACNYLWCAAILLIWLFVMAKDFICDLKLTPMQEILFAILSFVVGNYAENSSVGAVFTMLLFIAISLFYSKRKMKRWHITSLCAMLLGFFFLAFAPAELVTKIAKPSFSKYIKNFVYLVQFYLKYWPLILFYICSYVYSYKTKQAKNVRLLSLVLIGGSLAAQFVLVFALYVDTRSTFFPFTFLLLACAVLFQQLFTTKIRYFYGCLSAILLSFTLYWGIVGIQDLRTVHYKWTYNDELIRSLVAEGETIIKVPYIIPDTHYSCLYVWGYLMEDKTHYGNIKLAEYYGAEEISGYWFYDTK